jgi:uncharacterized membrane protein SpoIIM required for sporulation
MSSNRFIDERKGAWQRLEDLLTLLDRMSLRRLHREEVRELGRIYRRTSSDLAIARAESRDPRLVNYLNSLVIRAHGRIYRAGALEGGQQLRRFFMRDFPQTFRRTWRHTAAAFVVFMAFCLAGFLGTWRDAEFSDFGGITEEARTQIKTGAHWWEKINEANQVAGAGIMANNIQVMFNAFALGAMLGVGTLLVMAFNGLHIGAVLALTYRAGFGHELVAFMAGHGVIELTCIFIAGGAGLLIGGAILIPGDLSRFDALRLRGRDSIQLIVGCIPLLVLAAAIESFISPAPISRLIKFGVAIATGIGLYTYLLLAGREETQEGSATVSRAL